jgi:ABC-type transport system involved in multi-copper enzyme maturation permease subunit
MEERRLESVKHFPFIQDTRKYFCWLTFLPLLFCRIIFFLSVALTSGAMLIERNEGILERCLVSGVTGVEILASHVVTQFLVMCFQTTLVLIFSFMVFEITNKGELFWVILLVLETGLCGMCFGMLTRLR